MKKSLILCLVLSTTSSALAIPVFQVVPEKDHYTPSEIITINLVEDGQVIGMTVDAISDSGAGGVAFNETFASGWNTTFPGSLNTGGMLIEYMAASQSPPITPITGILYSFDYQIPDVPPSTWITIGSYDDGGDWYFAPQIDYDGGSSYIGPIGSVDIHYPEPATFALLALGGLLLKRRK